MLVRALLGSVDRGGRPSICPMTPVMWLELDHTKDRRVVLRHSSPNPTFVVHGVALHSHTFCYLAEGQSAGIKCLPMSAALKGGRPPQAAAGSFSHEVHGSRLRVHTLWKHG